MQTLLVATNNPGKWQEMQDLLAGLPLALRAPAGRRPAAAATDAARRRLLLMLLQPHPRPWTARFRCAVALASPDGALDLAEGICPGEILPQERGASGFGYDPIFLLQGSDRTMAELSLAEKNQRSHRARAVQALLPTLRARLGLPPAPP